MNPSPDISPTEEKVVAAIVAATLANQRKNRVPGNLARRDVHAKSHGTVKARFSVRAAIPAELKVGLFATPGEFDALVRFSNGKGGPDMADIKPNIRGVALKLFGVPGPKVLTGEENSTEHDFVLANHPIFFAPTIDDMLLISQRRKDDVRPHVKRLLLVSMLKLVGNPLHLSYYSQVPYAWGERACKFALVPVKKAPLLALPNPFDRDYLRHALERTLRHREVGYRFCVQLQQQPGTESLEDSTVPWAGPYVPVADLTFLRVTDPLQESDGESLSFNPARVLAAHRPLGWPGRVRRAVYAADYHWRKEQNASSGAGASPGTEGR